MKKYRVLYFGTWGYGKAGLEALLTLEQVEIVKIFSKWDLGNPNPYLNQVYRLGKENGIELIDSSRGKMPKEAFWKAILDTEGIDFLISCCYDRLFPTRILSFPKISALNMHPSLLPKYQGIKPLENALANGDSQIGVTLHELVKELDAGDILLQKSIDIDPYQTFEHIYSLQCELIKDCFVQFFSAPVRFVADKRAQDLSQKTYAPRLPFVINDSDKVHEIIRKNRQYT